MGTRACVAYVIRGVVGPHGVHPKREIVEAAAIHADRVERVRLHGDAGARDKAECRLDSVDAVVGGRTNNGAARLRAER
jgi:hypothetical protein